jgi:hypothetical protein
MLSLALTLRATVLLFTSSHVLVLMVMLTVICMSIGLFSSVLALLSELAAGSPGGSAIEHAKSKMSLHATTFSIWRAMAEPPGEQERWQSSSGDTHELDTTFNAEKYAELCTYFLHPVPEDTGCSIC